MARKKLRARRQGPLSPYPHHPRKPGIYVMYIDWPDTSQSCVPIYSEAFGAKRHLDILLQGLDYKVIKNESLKGIVDDRTVLVASNGIRVRCTLLQEILDHVDSPEEATWQMEERHVRTIHAFRYGTSLELPSVKAEADTESGLKRKKRRRERRRENAEPKKPRVTLPGMITVATIAASLNILPREARARLRKSDVPKPDSGWQWPEAEAKSIKELIAKG